MESDGDAPSSGSFSTKSLMAGAVVQTSSSSRPSIVILPETRRKARQRRRRARQQLAQLAARLASRVAGKSLRGIREHELVRLFDGLAAVLELLSRAHRHEPRRHEDTENKRYFIISVPP